MKSHRARTFNWDDGQFQHMSEIRRHTVTLKLLTLRLSEFPQRAHDNDSNPAPANADCDGTPGILFLCVFNTERIR